MRQRGDQVRGQAVGAEAVVVAEHEPGGAEAPLQDGPDVLLRRQAGKGPVEGQHLHPVHAQGAQQRLLLLRGIEQPQVARVLLEDGARMLREGNDNRLLALLAGGGDERLDDLAVSEMDPVEESGGDYSHLTSGKSWRCGSSGFFGKIRLATWYMPVCSGSTSVRKVAMPFS